MAGNKYVAKQWEACEREEGVWEDRERGRVVHTIILL